MVNDLDVVKRPGLVLSYGFKRGNRYRNINAQITKKNNVRNQQIRYVITLFSQQPNHG